MEIKRKAKRLTTLALALVLTLALVPAVPVFASDYLINDTWFDWSVSYSISPAPVVSEELNQWEQTVTVKTVSVGATLTINASATNAERPIGFEVFLRPEGVNFANRTILVEHVLLWSDIEQGEYAMFRYEPLPREAQIVSTAQTVTHVFDAPGTYYFVARNWDGWQNAWEEQIKIVVTGTPSIPGDITNTFRCNIFLAHVREITNTPTGAIQSVDVAGVTVLDIVDKGITSLAGIEHFTSLTQLEARYNQLTTIDLSANTALEVLNVEHNRLTTLDISANTALRLLFVSANYLTELNVTNNRNLGALALGDNRLSELDLSNNPNLFFLNISDNLFTEFDVTNNPALRLLNVTHNRLTALDVSNNPALRYLRTHWNSFAAPDDVVGWNNWFEYVGDYYEFRAVETDEYNFGFVFTPQRPEEQSPPTPADPNLSTASSWAQDGITEAVGLGLVPQNLQAQYTQATTRAEFASLAVALHEAVTGREITERATFDDTSDINVQKMAGLGVVNGVGGGNFNPNGTITREQAAVMLARLAEAIGQPLPASAPTFADNAGLSSWAVDGVGQIQAAGIMTGVGDNTFVPQDPYTREASIITILRLFNVLD